MAEAASPSSSDPSPQAESLSMGMKMMLKGIRMKFSSVRHLSTASLHQMMQEAKEGSTSKLLILDIRPEEEYNISHIEGAKRIEPEESGSSVVEKIESFIKGDSEREESATVVCYCSLGYRSSTMVQRLQKESKLKDKDNAAPFPKLTLYSLEGSLFKWANEKKPMVDSDNQATIYAHPFSTMFGKLLNRDLRKYPSKDSML